jgi:hypothetical protein
MQLGPLASPLQQPRHHQTARQHISIRSIHTRQRTARVGWKAATSKSRARLVLQVSAGRVYPLSSRGVCAAGNRNLLPSHWVPPARQERCDDTRNTRPPLREVLGSAGQPVAPRHHPLSQGSCTHSHADGQGQQCAVPPPTRAALLETWPAAPPFPSSLPPRTGCAVHQRHAQQPPSHGSVCMCSYTHSIPQHGVSQRMQEPFAPSVHPRTPVRPDAVRCSPCCDLVHPIPSQHRQDIFSLRVLSTDAGFWVHQHP